MMISKAFGSGIRAVNGRKRLWFVFYGVKTLWALAVVAPAMAILAGSLAGSAWAERMAGEFDIQWFAEMSVGEKSLVFVPAAVAGLLVLVLAIAAHLFLMGGALELYRTEEPFSLEAFGRGCGKHFWRFVRLALLALALLAILSMANRGLAAAGNKIWGEGSVEGPLVHWSWFRVAVVAALAGVGNLVLDYARVRMVAADTRKAFRSLAAAARFVFANFGRTAALYVAVWIIVFVLLAVYRGAAGAVGQGSMVAVLTVFVLRQAMVLAKTWTQLLFAASETEMYRSLEPVIAPAPAVVEIEAAPGPVEVADGEAGAGI